MNGNDVSTKTDDAAAATSHLNLEEYGLDSNEQHELGALEHEVRQLRSELDCLRNQQRSLQRITVSNDSDIENDAQEDTPDDTDSRRRMCRRSGATPRSLPA